MPKVNNDDIAPTPDLLKGYTVDKFASVALLAEGERFFQIAKSAAAYGIRAALDGSRGSVLLSERVYLAAWLSRELESLALKLKFDDIALDVAVAEYATLHARALASWEKDGGVLLFDGQLRAMRREAAARADAKQQKEPRDGGD